MMRAFIHYPDARKMVAAAIALLALTACATPEPLIITRPVYIDRVRLVQPPVPAELLGEHPIAEGAPSACLEVAAERREQIAACNADKAALRGLLGVRDE
jgi:hypothetical protein